MTSTQPDASYSPSLNHRYLMDALTPALAYDGGDVGAWQRRLRHKVKSLLGMPSGDRVALDVRSLWQRRHPLGSIEKIVFRAEPYADVMAYVCLPKAARPPYTWFICVQGHTIGAHVSIAVDREDNSVPIMVEGDRDFGLGCMARGIAALCIEQRSFGERRERHQERVSTHGCHDATMHALMLGRTLLGERVFDVDRGLDYLETRDDVDWSRVGIMGNSGGGTVSLFSAAVLPRLRYAMPSCYFCTFRDSIMSIYHCADNYVPRTAPIRGDGRRDGPVRTAPRGARRWRARRDFPCRSHPARLCRPAARSTPRPARPTAATWSSVPRATASTPTPRGR